MTRIVICGANGKMGKNIYNCIQDRDDCKVIAGVDVFTKEYADFPIVAAPDKLPPIASALQAEERCTFPFSLRI